MMKFRTRVAGVTFRNSDGMSRQEILKSLPHIISVRFKKTKYEGEPAIQIIEKSTNQVIGWIPKENIKSLWDVTEATGFIKKHKDIFFCELREVIPPNRQIYHLISQMCKANKITKPAYDICAYVEVLKVINMNK